MAVILVIIVIYYLQVYHTRIIEKYTGAASNAIHNFRSGRNHLYMLSVLVSG